MNLSASEVLNPLVSKSLKKKSITLQDLLIIINVVIIIIIITTSSSGN